MNAVEIAEAVAELVEEPFKPEEFPYSFLAAFDNPPATIDRLKSGTTNNSDVGGVLQRNNIHILSSDTGRVGDALKELRESAATTSQKAKFILATDGVDVEAEDISSGETLACSYTDLDEKFGFFLPLANITTVREIRESSFDIKATGRLNKLYVELLKHNPEWSKADKRHEMNHFMARLIFCFFAEDTGIFGGDDLLTSTIEKMSARDGSDVHIILNDIFKTMNTNYGEREKVGLPRWTNVFPYVNGGLFSGSTEVPAFTKIARTYLLHIGRLDWTKINPDVFGSMIQAVADENERGELGMHYTSVPNILKVLNPLFLNNLRQKLEEAGNNARKLLNLRNRIKRIRIFDPACGSGNFLVIAYKEMREIEAEINARRKETHRRTEIPITNFRGIEFRDFSAEIARLALIIAEYQCDAAYIGQKEAVASFLPLDTKNWITCGNALKIDWLSVCPPTETRVRHVADDLLMINSDKAEVDFQNEGGETYICGNPPYVGSKRQSPEQKEDLKYIFEGRVKNWKSLDYVAGWFMKAADFGQYSETVTAFVSTNSICQGQQVPILWSSLLSRGQKISFAYQNFKWANLAAHNAGVTVVIVGLTSKKVNTSTLFQVNSNGQTISRICENINPYLIAGADVIVAPQNRPISGLPEMARGNSPTDGGNLLLEKTDIASLGLNTSDRNKFIKPFIGSRELINGGMRYCIWIDDNDVEEAKRIPSINSRIDKVKNFRLESRKEATKRAADWSHRFDERKPIPKHPVIVIPVISSENRKYLPVDFLNSGTIVSNKAFFVSGEELWPFAIICSTLNRAWVGAVCARMRTDFSYTNTLGWNTLPTPKLTTQNKQDLAKCAEDILLVRQKYFPATISELYQHDNIPKDLRAAHDRNDEIIEQIYIGRRFKNDTERLEILFTMYDRMTTIVPPN